MTRTLNVPLTFLPWAMGSGLAALIALGCAAQPEVDVGVRQQAESQAHATGTGGAPATCSDGMQSAGETDIDCGGSTGCGACVEGRACVVSSDCQSGYCSAGTCERATCRERGQVDCVREPEGFEDYSDFRQYASLVSPMLDNLAAHPAVRQNEFANVAIQCLVTDTSATQLALLDSSMAKARALSPPMPIYPAMRLFPNQQFSDWTNRDYWVLMASKLESLAAHRAPGDRRIGLDIENYATGSESTIRRLAAAGKSPEDLRIAIQPFLDKARDLGILAQVYPVVEAVTPEDHNEFVMALLDTLGPDGVQVWWEDSFGASERYRRSPMQTFPTLAATMHANEAEFERYYGRDGLKHRHVVDDDLLREWGAPIRESGMNFLGPIRPWIFDLTRLDRASAGTPGWVAGTTLRSANDVAHAFAFAPQTTRATSVGTAEAPVTLVPFRGNASSWAVGPGTIPDLDGIRLQPPVGSSVSGLKGDVMPAGSGATRWFLDFTFQLPSVVDGNLPILSQATNNVGSWQVYFDPAADKLVLQVAQPRSATRTFDILNGPIARNIDLRIQLGRDGDLDWLFSAPGLALTRVTVAAVAPSHATLWVGSGEAPATFPSNYTLASCPNLLIKNLNVWHRVPSAAEVADQIHSGQYPWGRGL